MPLIGPWRANRALSCDQSCLCLASYMLVCRHIYICIVCFGPSSPITLVCLASQQSCLQCYTAFMLAVSPSQQSAAWHGRHIYSVTQQTCLVWDTAAMSAVRSSTHFSCGTQQTCLLIADMSTVWRSRHVCCVAQQTRLPCDSADMSATCTCCRLASVL